MSGVAIASPRIMKPAWLDAGIANDEFEIALPKANEGAHRQSRPRLVPKTNRDSRSFRQEREERPDNRRPQLHDDSRQQHRGRRGRRRVRSAPRCRGQRPGQDPESCKQEGEGPGLGGRRNECRPGADRSSVLVHCVQRATMPTRPCRFLFQESSLPLRIPPGGAPANDQEVLRDDASS